MYEWDLLVDFDVGAGIGESLEDGCEQFLGGLERLNVEESQVVEGVPLVDLEEREVGVWLEVLKVE